MKKGFIMNIYDKGSILAGELIATAIDNASKRGIKETQLSIFLNNNSWAEILAISEDIGPFGIRHKRGSLTLRGLEDGSVIELSMAKDNWKEWCNNNSGDYITFTGSKELDINLLKAKNLKSGVAVYKKWSNAKQKMLLVGLDDGKTCVYEISKEKYDKVSVGDYWFEPAKC